MVVKISKLLLIFVLTIGWIFSGWPRIWNNPSVPSEIKEAQSIFFNIPRVDLGTLTTGSWQTKDISAYVPAEATGAIFELTTTAEYYLDIRHPDVTNDFHTYADLGGAADSFHIYRACGLKTVGSEKQFQYYVENTAAKLYLVGYTDDRVEWVTGALPDKSTATASSWQDVVVSEAPDGATAAIFRMIDKSTFSKYRGLMRQKGSTDDATPADKFDIWDKGTITVMVGLDENKTAQQYIENANIDLYLEGWVKGSGGTRNIIWKTNKSANKAPTADGAFHTVDLTDDTSANAVGIILDVANNSATTYDYTIRKYSDTDTGNYYGIYIRSHTFVFVECDAEQQIEIKIANAALEVYVVGYVEVSGIVAPTVTTQAASDVEATTATGNGAIENTGGEDASAWGVCYKTSSGCTTADDTAAGSGSGGAGAFTASMTGLNSGTTYYIKAFATNLAGTGYGDEVTILTKPAEPTGVSATDGDHTDKVTITWTKSTGATDYHVWRDSTDLGSAGDVAIYDDTGADAPTVTSGSAAASDGTSSAHVELSLSGTSANNGTTHTYKVVASNATGNSADSDTDTGYRGVGSLEYQWQRSAADSDADYSNIDGATTASYNDTGAPANGDGRYYKCVLNATGAIQQTSASDRGYRQAAVVSITLNRETFDYGKVPNNTASSTLNLWAGAGITATNGDVIADFYIYGADSTGTGSGWILNSVNTGNNYIHKFCDDTESVCASPPTNYTDLTTSPQLLEASVAADGTVVFQLEITTPQEPVDVSQQSAVVTVQATEP